MIKYNKRAESLFILEHYSHKNTITKYLGGTMTIGEIAGVRTGLVTARKKKSATSLHTYKYRLLNLKCIENDGHINICNVEEYQSSEELKPDYFTHMGDILIRLSAPYTAVFINQTALCGIVIPSHFAIIRVDKRLAIPEYIFWSLQRDKNRITMMQNSSGSTTFGTISSGLISSLPITLLPIQNQQIIGNLHQLCEREQELLNELEKQKKIYNTLFLNQIYDNMKRGNIK